MSRRCAPVSAGKCHAAQVMMGSAAASGSRRSRQQGGGQAGATGPMGAQPRPPRQAGGGILPSERPEEAVLHQVKGPCPVCSPFWSMALAFSAGRWMLGTEQGCSCGRRCSGRARCCVRPRSQTRTQPETKSSASIFPLISFLHILSCEIIIFCLFCAFFLLGFI